MHSAQQCQRQCSTTPPASAILLLWCLGRATVPIRRWCFSPLDLARLHCQRGTVWADWDPPTSLLSSDRIFQIRKPISTGEKGTEVIHYAQVLWQRAVNYSHLRPGPAPAVTHRVLQAALPEPRGCACSRQRSAGHRVGTGGGPDVL